MFIPQKVADRLRNYAAQACTGPDDRIFPISYEAARDIVAKAGKVVGIKLPTIISAVMLPPMHPDQAFL